MEIHLIQTTDDYIATLKEIENLMLAKPNSPEGKILDMLSALVEVYESTYYPLEVH